MLRVTAHTEKYTLAAELYQALKCDCHPPGSALTSSQTDSPCPPLINLAFPRIWYKQRHACYVCSPVCLHLRSPVCLESPSLSHESGINFLPETQQTFSWLSPLHSWSWRKHCVFQNLHNYPEILHCPTKMHRKAGEVMRNEPSYQARRSTATAPQGWTTAWAVWTTGRLALNSFTL